MKSSFVKFKTTVSILTGVLFFIALLPVLFPIAIGLAILIWAKILKLHRIYDINIDDVMTAEVPNEVNEISTISKKGQKAIAESLMNLMEGEEKSLDDRFNEYCKENDVRFNDIK